MELCVCFFATCIYDFVRTVIKINVSLNFFRMKNFLDIKDISTDDLNKILELALKIKVAPESYYSVLEHKKMILLLEKNSTRTRISFELGMKELGGTCCVLNSSNTQISRGESIEDTARVFNEMADCAVIRTFSHERLLKLAKYFTNGCVINALTDKSHPCQIMADIMTFMENKKEKITGKKIAWFGDINNVLLSWLEASEKFGFKVNICCPTCMYEKLTKLITAEGRQCEYQLFSSKIEAANGCDIITTDTWVSMGEDKSKSQIFLNGNFIVDESVMQNANKSAIFLHCLPAYRGYEVASEVIDNPIYSNIIFQEAGNRLHVQKAILMYCFGLC